MEMREAAHSYYSRGFQNDEIAQATGSKVCPMKVRRQVKCLHKRRCRGFDK